VTVIYGYARVSGPSQDLAAQLADLEAAGRGRIDREKIGAETGERPQLKRLSAIAGSR
jgi:DNA invertase Pin-like site-specific DNA recombinase